MTKRKRVLFLIPHLGGGGAERVIALVAGGLSCAKYEVHVGVVTRSSYAGLLPSPVTVHALGASRVRAAIVPLVRLIWQLKPDLVFSGMFHLNFLVLLLRPLLPGRTRCVVRQNGLTSEAAETGRPARILYRMLYPRAEAVVCQSETMAGELRRLLGNARKLHVLPNPVAVSDAANRVSGSLWDGAGPHLLAVGRLVPSKGFDMLLRAFAQVVERFPSADLTIVGHGPQKEALRELCLELRIDRRVHLAGYVERPEKWFPGASAFVLSSHHEAMPNAMLEAAMAGLPVIATPAHGGVETLLRGRPGAWIAKEIGADALAQAMCAALGALQPGERFHHEWIAPFRAPDAVARYERLIDDVLAGATA